MTNEGYIWTTLHHRESGQYFEVTTMDRISSSPYTPEHIYSETFVWEHDSKTGKKGRILAQYEDRKGSAKIHVAICEKLLRMGLKALDEEES